MKYYDNQTIYCTNCSKLIYMGYTSLPDSELCTCSKSKQLQIMSKQEIIDAIKVLSDVVKANAGWFGNEQIIIEANRKIKKLIELL